MSQDLYHSQIIKCRNHQLRLSLKTGNHSVKPLEPIHWSKAPYEKGATCPTFNELLLYQFDLCMEPEEVLRHFWECIGYLLCPSQIMPVKVALYGDDNSGRGEVSKIVLPIIANEKRAAVCIAAGPPDRVHSDFDIAHVTAIPFYGVYHRLSDVPVYGFDVAADAEVSGVLNEALKGLKRLVLRGHFDQPKDCAEATLKYLRTADHIGAFIREKVVSVDDNKVRVTSKEMYDEYVFWSSEPNMTLTKTEMVQELESRGFKYRNVSGTRRAFFGTALIKKAH